MLKKGSLLFLISVFLALAMIGLPPAFAFKAKGQAIQSDVYMFVSPSAALTTDMAGLQVFAVNSSVLTNMAAELFSGYYNNNSASVYAGEFLKCNAKRLTDITGTYRANEEPGNNISLAIMLSRSLPNPFDIAASQGKVTSVYQAETVDKSGGTEMLARLASVRIIELIDGGACIKTVKGKNNSWVAPEKQRSYGDMAGPVSGFRLCPNNNGINTEITVIAKTGRIALGA